MFQSPKPPLAISLFLDASDAGVAVPVGKGPPVAVDLEQHA